MANNCTSTPPKDVFTLCSNIQDNYNDVYCCIGNENKFLAENPFVDQIFVANGTCVNFEFPNRNTDNQPMLKSVLNATAQSPWVRVGFQQYCTDGSPSNSATNQSVITTGNVSQGGGGSSETCNAAIKTFQYGWGNIESGNRCRITIIDEKGGTFETWAKRMATNTEGMSTPIRGSYKMKVQFGWYITGGGADDQCGQPAAYPTGVPTSNGTPSGGPGPGQNSSYNICSPTLWFIPDMITVNWENGKFIYTLEGVDSLVRGQEQTVNKVFGEDGSFDPTISATKLFSNAMFFTDAVQLLGKYSTPPFRVRFLSIDANGATTNMQFLQRDNNGTDNLNFGPYEMYSAKSKKPLDIIRGWITNTPVWAIDQTGLIQTPGRKIGITFNYDSIQNITQPMLTNFPVNDTEAEVQGPDNLVCNPSLPNNGTMILWAANAVPHNQTNIPEDQMNQRMKAVYLVNGGNCSPVLAFNPVIRWHFLLGLKAGGYILPIQGRASKTTDALNAVGMAVSGGQGMWQAAVAAAAGIGNQSNAAASVQQTSILNIAGNMAISGIEAELRVQGDPSNWLCSPIFGLGKCVGIIFINPFFLDEDPEGDCPQFMQTTDGLCNNILTNKGWFIRGVEHQIKEGSYITTLKLALPAPGSELKFGDGLEQTGLGAWQNGALMQFGGRNANTNEYPRGNLAAAWVQQAIGPIIVGGGGCAPVCYVGGGSACASGAICDTPEGFCEDESPCDGTMAGVPCPPIS